MPNVGLEETRTLSISVDGNKVGSFVLTSRYTHLCGSESNPTKCSVGEEGFHLYDDFHLLFGSTAKAGSKIRVYKDAGDTATYYVVDFIDLELVAAPIEYPGGYANIIDFGAKEGENCSPAFKAAVAAAVSQKLKGIWIPAGRWGMDYIDGVVDTGKIVLPPEINSHPTKFEIAGAGMWYSVIFSMRSPNDDWGRNWGFDCQGQTVYYHDFQMNGENRIRVEGGKPLVNGYGQNTVIDHLWIEHSTIGFWVGGAYNDFPESLTLAQRQSNGLIIRNSRCRNTGADGINLCAGTTNALIEHVNCRSNGDDAFAIWSEADGWVDADKISPGGNQDNTIRFCTAELTWRANGLGLYGGRNNVVSDLIIRDILVYHGIMVDGTTFPSVKPSGILTITRCTLLRTSGFFWGEQTYAAIGIYNNEGQKVTFKDLEVYDSWYGAIRNGGDGDFTFQNVLFDTFCNFECHEPGGVWGMGFIGPWGNGVYTFHNVTQKNWGGKGNSFYANAKTLQGATYNIDPDCNFDENGPK